MSLNDINNTPILPFDIITVNNGQGGTMMGDYVTRLDWNLEGNNFKITLTDIYSRGALNNIKYFEINKLFGIG